MENNDWGFNQRLEPLCQNLEYFSSSFDEGYIRSDEFRCRGDAIKL